MELGRLRGTVTMTTVFVPSGSPAPVNGFKVAEDIIGKQDIYIVSTVTNVELIA